jgi:hypothetical protein
LSPDGQECAGDSRHDYDRADLAIGLKEERDYVDHDNLFQIAADDVGEPQNQDRNQPELRLLPELKHHHASAITQ